ncbi:hypothetical protein PybrP1_009634 [[Pythium] brassicae (nom. inval.)]|nr:hypothetical protein PybrP1_009634 [[Pythium] brassicae (nom. inval.)]
MWAKRSAAAASTPSSSSSAAAAAAPRPPPPASSTGTSSAPDADVAWLLRAAERKRLKAKSPKRSVTTTAPLPPPPTATPLASDAAASKSATVPRKRPLSAGASAASAAAQRKRPAASTTSAMSWKQRQQAWNAPLRNPKPAPTNDAEQHEDARNESFEQVFLEVFGRQEHERARQRFSVEHLEPGALTAAPRVAGDAAAAPSGDSGGGVDTATASSRPHALPTTAGPSAASSSSSSEWGFKSTSAAIRVDDFEPPRAAASGSGSVRGGDAAGEFARWKDAGASRAVSDNFVKLHMRKRVKGSTGKARKRPAYLRARYDPTGEDGGAATHDAFMDPSAVRARAAAPSSASASAASGAMNDGLDFIEECLEVLARVEAQRASDGPSPTPAASSSSSSGAGAQEAAAASDVPPPRCHHALPCTTVAVKKKTKNHGRAFFACPLGVDEGRCDFFLWADNHAQLALQTLFQARPPAADAPDAALSSVPDFVPLDLARPLTAQADALVTNLRLVFGHAGFRAGQQWAIERVFARQHALLVLPTGAGKSLCYQFPALFLPGLTLVISPLIALMHDQFETLPPVLRARAACLTSAAAGSKAQYAAFVRDLLGGHLRLVFLSPERAVSRGFQQLLAQVRARVALVCVDEAHCISEWSHHFRPSYLRLRALFALAPCVLALTATASARVVRDVTAQLRGGADMVLQMPWQRRNLALRVQRVRSNDERLAHLARFLAAADGAAILYVHQQRHAEDLAAVLREQLPGGAARWARRIAYYHARMDADAKEKVRAGFLSGRVRVVIATIAFGMGIDKQNVRCVVHVHLPSSVENYLQQVGRAGRDGKPAAGLLYLLPDDVRTFRSLAFSNAFHADQLRRLLTRVVFADSDDSDKVDDSVGDRSHVVAVRRAAAHDSECDVLVHVSLEVAWLEAHVDMKAATIETFLTLLALATDDDSDDACSRQARPAAGTDIETQHPPPPPPPTASRPLRVQLQPSSMATCVLHVVEKKLRDAPPDGTLKRIVRALESGSSPRCRHGRVDKETNGYLSTFVVEFHVRAMAELLFGAGGGAPLPVAAAPDSGAAAVGSVCERRLLQHVRAMQQDGLIQRFALERHAFQLDLAWRRGARADAKTKRALVDAWTAQLYAKHVQLEAAAVGRLTRLYGALHAASREHQRRDADADDADDAAEDDEAAARREDARVLEAKLVEYFAHESVAPPDEALMKTLLQPLTPNAIDAIEHDVRALVRLPVCEAPEDGSDGDGDDWGDLARTTTRGGGGGSAGKKSAAMSSKQATAELRREMAATRWTSYSVAKVFHGLASPCFPLLRWRDHGCWKKYDAFAFEQLVRIAEKVLVEENAPDKRKCETL